MTPHKLNTEIAEIFDKHVIELKKYLKEQKVAHNQKITIPKKVELIEKEIMRLIEKI